jgi:hypothetical protein
MRNVQEVLRKSMTVAAQRKIEIVRSMHVHRTKGGIPVLSIHYSADPERDPQIHPQWKETERRTYSSQAAWDREQEMVDEAGGGELVFADTLVTYWNKIVITDPGWRPSPHWRVEGGERICLHDATRTGRESDPGTFKARVFAGTAAVSSIFADPQSADSFHPRRPYC